MMVIIVLGGYLGHAMYKRRGPNVISFAHKWLARGVITLGFVNGGLGILLSSPGTKYYYIYGIIGGVIILTWWAFALKNDLKPKKAVDYEGKLKKETSPPGHF
jgi:hypothetical protein